MREKPTIDPTCKYGHGPLVRVTAGGVVREWSLLAVEGPNLPFVPSQGFSLALFICSNCGYSELFDLDPDQTINDESKK